MIGLEREWDWDYNLIIIIKLRWVLFVTYTIIQSINSSEMRPLHLTHPSAHTWSSGQPTLRCPGSSGGSVPCCWSRDSNRQPQVTSPTLYPLEPRLPHVIKRVIGCQNWLFKLFEHKCVLEVCVHIHPIMIKIHPVFFLNPHFKTPFLKSGCCEIPVTMT